MHEHARTEWYGARDARAEARLRTGGRPALVLEPSPPAVDDGGRWMADDPLAAGPADAIRTTGRGPTWSDLARDDRALREWCAQRFLLDEATVAPPPATLATTRLSLHRLAMYVMAAARISANGFMGLRWTLGGFGTPFFDHDQQVRVVGCTLVSQRGDSVRTAPLTTLAEAAAFLGVPLLQSAEAEYDVPPMGDPHAGLGVDPAAAAWLSAWFGLGTMVLERVRAQAHDGGDTRVQLWPEHFDVAIELGDAVRGERASIGLSPGDTHHPEPYAYVAPWEAVPDSPTWNAVGFRGAQLAVRQVVGTERPALRLATFIEEARSAIRADGTSSTNLRPGTV